MSEAAEPCFRLEGGVTFDNLRQLRREGEEAIAGAAGPAVVDLSGLEDANSAAVALLMAWFRAAENRGTRITFAHVPDGVRSIIDLSGMSDVLPVSTTTT